MTDEKYQTKLSQAQFVKLIDVIEEAVIFKEKITESESNSFALRIECFLLKRKICKMMVSYEFDEIAVRELKKALDLIS